MTQYGLLQWNVQGLRSKKDEILELIQLHKINIMAFQETKLWTYNNFSIPHFNIIRKDGHFNHTPHGGVALLIHESIPHESITLNTPIQAVAARVRLHKTITICNIYSSNHQVINYNLLYNIYQQLPQPILIVGDFNAYNILWGCRETKARGREIENFIITNNLNILNNGAPTRISHETETAIDLSICSPQLDTDFHWSVSNSPGDSDHCYILITYEDPTNDIETTNWNIKQARWDIYRTSTAWNTLLDTAITSNEDLTTDLHQRLLVASIEAIPQFQCSKYYPKPWWNKELKE